MMERVIELLVASEGKGVSSEKLHLNAQQLNKLREKIRSIAIIKGKRTKDSGRRYYYTIQKAD
jgi:hypothetical protein